MTGGTGSSTWLIGRSQSALADSQQSIAVAFCVRALTSAPSSAEKLRSVAHRAKAGLPQLIVAATALYLHRLTGVQDLVLGLPVTARLGAVSRRTPGMLSNVLPLRLTVHPGTSLSELIEQVAEHVRRGLLHQRYRTEDLSRDLGLLAHDQKLFGTSVNVMTFDHELLLAGHRTTTRNLSNGPGTGSIGRGL